MKNFFYLTMLSIVILATSCSKVEDQLNDASYLNGVSSSIETISLPTTVTNLVADQYPGFAISSTEASNTAGKYNYNVNIENANETVTVSFDNSWSNAISDRGGKGGPDGGKGGPGGKGFHPKDSTRTPVKLADLCQGAKDYVATNYVGYEIKKALKRDSSGVITFIVLVEKDTLHVALIFDANCNFVSIAPLPIGHGNGGGHGKGKGHGTVVDLTTIPASVTSFLATSYTGFTISKAVYVDGKGTPRYIVEITDGTNKKVLVFDANWAFVKEL